ncbi:MAG TPA: peptide chain release factor N(5)-glutamine methyltransferase [Chloroflexota bacterium]|jgi:release factor glutamine methyltransferase|nr:peptide chain release factor N(5)-glutamine methyltransferase [Chloroflexota bacterium]
MTTVAEARLAGKRRLEAVETPGLDADVLLAHVLETGREHLFAAGEDTLSGDEETRYGTMLAQRVSGSPVTHLTGSKMWFGLDLIVGPTVLTPRPETETLVEIALQIARTAGMRSIADIGTGSGAIAIALAIALPDAQVVASDISSAAVDIARSNAERHGVSDRVSLVVGDLLDSAKGEPEMIVANLPYVREADRPLVSREVLAEPGAALFSGEEGLDHISRLIRQIADLNWRSTILLEIDPRQAEPLRAMVDRVLPRATVEIMKDLAGRNRVCIIRPESASEKAKK